MLTYQEGLQINTLDYATIDGNPELSTAQLNKRDNSIRLIQSNLVYV